MTDLAAWIASKRAASEGATEGPWTLLPAIDWFPHRVILRIGLPSISIPVRNRSEEDAAEIAANARHIAAFDPATTRRLLDAVEASAKAIEAVRGLIAQSEGVAGLHLNGDVAPWADLMTGGRYEEWLTDLDRAKAALDALRGGE